tara:strand:- start:7074 stop:8177 length:1104 start_codon:yes stop_codon:yes gene_type:complete
MSKDDLVLSPEQKFALVSIKDRFLAGEKVDVSLMHLIQNVAGFEGRDGRSKEGRAVKAFLSEIDLSGVPSNKYQKVYKPELLGEHKEFIRNNRGTMKYVEMSRILFSNEKLASLSAETRMITEYCKSLEGESFETSEEEGSYEYKSPKHRDRVLSRINRFILDSGIDKDKVTPRQKKDIDMLMGYLHTFRFGHQMTNYNNGTERELFESSFVRYTYNKPDLTQEEVDQYIVLSGEVVIASNIQRRVGRLQNLLDETALDNEGRRISMSLVEAISTAQNEYNSCVNRQHKLLSDLKQKRSDRLSKQVNDNASILNLVETWKDDESRKELIKMAELRKKTIKDEIIKLSTMDDVKARIFGISTEEALNG